MVSLDHSVNDFEEFTGGLPFMSVSDFKGWDSPMAQNYYVFGTPTMYLLNDQREILLRPNSVKHMDAWVDWFVLEKRWLLASGCWPLADGFWLPTSHFHLPTFLTFDFEVINRSATYDPMCLRRVKRNHLGRLSKSMKWLEYLLCVYCVREKSLLEPECS